ncbi:hypothetical protein [Microscilla marina]|nr:hypothetical protein [Microscilla marina]
MKNPSKTFTTKEGQKPPIQAKQRPIQAKQRPIQAKQRPIQAKQSPIQRKPNVDNQDLKTQMGKQYGVDLSGYKEHQNSSFPDKVGAQATIQGKDIHYASGQFTLQNRKHELGHAIDNTLNGTPQGNTTIQGYNIDTTREEVADKIMHTPLQKQSDDTTPVVQQKSKSSGKTVLQRKGEKKALRNTLEPNPDLGYKRMRRGNRRGSVSDTHGLSTVKVVYLRNYTDMRETTVNNKTLKDSFFNRELKAQKQAIGQCLPHGTDVEKWITQNYNALTAYLFSYLGAGNCGTFGSVIFEQLIAHTTDQLVARCSMVDTTEYYDHGFTVTLPANAQFVNLQNAIVRVTKDNRGNIQTKHRKTVRVLANSVDPKKCTIVDGWNNYQLQTLDQFQQKDNVYGSILNNANIRVQSYKRATGYDPVEPIREILQSIGDGCLQDLEQQVKNNNQQFIRNPWSNWTKYPRIRNYKDTKDGYDTVSDPNFDENNATDNQKLKLSYIFDFPGRNTVNDQRPLGTQLEDPDTTRQEIEVLLKDIKDFDIAEKEELIKSFNWNRYQEMSMSIRGNLYKFVRSTAPLTRLFLQTINNNSHKVKEVLGGDNLWKGSLTRTQKAQAGLLLSALNPQDAFEFLDGLDSDKKRANYLNEVDTDLLNLYYQRGNNLINPFNDIPRKSTIINGLNERAFKAYATTLNHHQQETLKSYCNDQHKVWLKEAINLNNIIDNLSF